MLRGLRHGMGNPKASEYFKSFYVGLSAFDFLALNFIVK